VIDREDDGMPRRSDGACAAVRRFASALIAASTLLPIAPASAQDRYPARPIRMVVGFSAGGGPDIVTRLIAPRLSAILGQQIVVDNRPGAGGSIAEDIVAKATADGYTVLACSSSLSINPFLYATLPYDPSRDLAPVSLTGISAQTLVVRPNFVAKNVTDLVAMMKARPGQVTYASSGIGAGSHLAGELLKLLAAVDMTHVPYKGGGQGVAAVLAGETDLMFAPIATAIPQVRAGRLRAMAVTTSRRSKAAPEVPTMVEAGIAGYEAFPWYGLLVPVRTPRPVIDALERAVGEVLAQPDLAERMLTLGVEPPVAGRAEFTRLFKAEMDRWSQVVRKAGLRADGS
jgi:tripartite-type tricarboxylate transporter receptor subunit TctC